MKMLLLFVATLSMVGCGAYNYPKYPLLDVGTEAEHELIQESIAEIEELSQSMGYMTNYRKVPIYIVPNHFRENSWAYCRYWQNDRSSGKYIGIQRRFFSGNNLKGKNLKDNVIARNDMLMLLLHEYGHCIFDRDHDDTSIGSSSKSLFLKIKIPDGLMTQTTRSIPASALSTKWNPTAISDDIKKYYIRELHGDQRWRTIDDLKGYDGVEIIDREEESLAEIDAYLNTPSFDRSFRVGDSVRIQKETCEESLCKKATFKVQVVEKDRTRAKLSYTHVETKKINFQTVTRSQWESARGNSLRRHIQNIESFNKKVDILSISFHGERLENGTMQVFATVGMKVFDSKGQFLRFEKILLSKNRPGLFQILFHEEDHAHPKRLKVTHETIKINRTLKPK